MASQLQKPDRFRVQIIPSPAILLAVLRSLQNVRVVFRAAANSSHIATHPPLVPHLRPLRRRSPGLRRLLRRHLRRLRNCPRIPRRACLRI